MPPHCVSNWAPLSFWGSLELEKPCFANLVNLFGHSRSRCRKCWHFCGATACISIGQVALAGLQLPVLFQVRVLAFEDEPLCQVMDDR